MLKISVSEKKNQKYESCKERFYINFDFLKYIFGKIFQTIKNIDIILSFSTIFKHV